MKKIVSFGIVLSAVALAFEGLAKDASVFLVRGGKAQAHVVVGAGDSQAVTNAAAALRHWTKEKTGADLDGATPIRFRLVDAAADCGFKYDGFRVDASEREIVISAKVPRAFEFAVHYLLSRYAGIDWFHPESGADFSPSDRFVIPSGTLARTPPLWRAGMTPGTWKGRRNEGLKVVADWNARNGFYADKRRMGGHIIGEWLLWTPVDGAELKAETANVLTNFAGVFRAKPRRDVAELYARWKILARQHPDWFALVEGRRVPCGQELMACIGRTAMPCLSNPEVRRQMLKNYMERRHSLWFAAWPDVVFEIICDDHPCWCECDNCMKLIRHKGTKGGEDKAADYYWDFVNWIAPRMLAADPTLTINAYAYQSHRAFPKRVKPQPQGDRLNVVVCTHGRCYMHPLTNAACQANAMAKKMIEDWHGAGFPVLTMDYQCQTPGRCNYFFWERAWIDDLRWYRANGICHGFGLMGPWYGHTGNEKYYFDMNGAKARWFTAWLSGHFAWDPDDDFDAVRDRMLTKYYRSAGKKMNAYHRYLERKLYDAGLHMGYTDTSEGAHDLFSQCVAGRPGVLEPARKLLAAAKRAAKGDPLALERIAWDERYFEEEWEKAAEMVKASEYFKSIGPLTKEHPADDYNLLGFIKAYPEIISSFRVSFKAKGRAKLKFSFQRGRDYILDRELEADSGDWRGYSFDFATNGRLSGPFLVRVNGHVEFKDWSVRAVRVGGE